MTKSRRLMLVVLAGLLVVCAVASGGAWYATRCDQSTFHSLGATSWVNSQERYFYGCGQVWHSLDGGQSWAQIGASGLPLLAREGHIAIDITPGHLYLGLLLSDPVTLTCPLCPLLRVEPAVYTSEDGGQHWRLLHKFSGGTSGVIRFRQLTADPNYPGSAWAIIQHENTNVYYATNTGGRAWLQTCVETPPVYCDPPGDFMAAHYAKHGDNAVP